jgi:polyisoprenoid-binding protein YceI
MKAVFFLIAIMFALVANGQEAYKFNKEESKVEWLGYKISGQHNGLVKISSAEVKINSTGVPSNGKIVIDMTSISCLDIEDKKMNKKLVDHLKSEDFFEVGKYPEAVYRITSAEKAGEGKVKISGLLTIKNKTNPYDFEADFSKVANGFLYESDWKISRGKYYVNVDEDADLVNHFKDSMIKEHFDLKIRILFVR